MLPHGKNYMLLQAQILSLCAPAGAKGTNDATGVLPLGQKFRCIKNFLTKAMPFSPWGPQGYSDHTL